ncbi:hypothetical protein [Ruegeria pomeroyi]|uniref:hypothetical protein n=1 Tax=Ruegeria pomeroyi TaxID=89184 RepID=UPI001F43F321|nr:hypothetical protein [Ruegeria pomeroyi]
MTVSATSGDILNSVSHQPETDADARALARRHRGLLEAALAATGYGGKPVELTVMTAPAFTDSTAGPVSWPPSGARLVSPWLALSKTGSGRVSLTLFASDLRVIADGALRAQDAAPEAFATGPGWRSMSFACLARAAESYVSHVSAGQPPESWAVAEDCVPGPLAGPLAWAFRTAPQNFFVPFDMTVTKWIEMERGNSAAFYKALYVALLRHGLPLLDDEAGAVDTWWHAALREIDE